MDETVTWVVRRGKRVVSGRTQAEVALEADINPSKLSLYERGLVELTGAELKKLDGVLNKQERTIKLSDLLGSTAKEEKVQASLTRKWARKRAGLTQRQIAQLIGVDQAVFSRWEAASARKIFNDEMVVRIFEIYESRTKSGSKADLYKHLEWTADYGEIMFGHVQKMQKELSLLRQDQKKQLAQERAASDKRLAEERAAADRRMEEIAGSYQRSIVELEEMMQTQKKEPTPKDGD